MNCPRRRGYGRWWCQFRACVVKHIRTAVREPWAAATQVAVPLALVLSAAVLGKQHVDQRMHAPLPVDPVHAVAGWPGVVAGSERARQSPVYLPFVDGLGDSYNAWNDTALDPALMPFVLPQPDTLDGSLMDTWYSSSHIYSGVFVERLPNYIPRGIIDPSESLDQGEDEDACIEYHNTHHSSVDSPEDERSFSRRMHVEKHDSQSEDSVYVHAVSCTEALRHGMAEEFSWVAVRQFVACTLSLDKGKDPLHKHSLASLHDADLSVSYMYDKLPEESNQSSGCLRGAEACSEEGDDGEAGQDTNIANIHAQKLAKHKHHPAHLCGREPLVEVTLLVNETAKHAVPYALNSANNAALRALAGKGFMANATLSVTLEAFPVVPSEQWAVVSKQLQSGMLIMFSAFALSVLAASFVVVPVKERVSGSLHVQMVSGMSPSALWGGMLVTDVAIFCVPGCLILLALAWANPAAFGWAHMPLLVTFMLTFALSSISLMYAAHQLFADEMKALLAMSSFLSASGVLGFFVSIIFDALVKTGSDNPTLQFWDSLIDTFLHLFSPTFLAMQLLSGVMTRKSGAEDWSLKNGDGGTIAWLCVQLALNMVILLITTSGLVADMMHIAETAVSKHAPWLNPSLKALEDAHSHEGEVSGGIARGPSRPVIFSQDMTGTFEAPSSGVETPLLPGQRAAAAVQSLLPKFASWASFGGFGGIRQTAGGVNNGNAAASSSYNESSSGLALPPAPLGASLGRGSGSKSTSTALREEVQEHAEVVDRANPQAYMVVLRKVAKVFTTGNWCRTTGSTVAVHDLSIAVPPQHCFGLLGTNGAGKTTTFRMLTNELRPTCGDVYLAGHRLSAALAPARRSTGYCPQSGGLTTALSVCEVLEFYAGIRGLPEVDVDTAVLHALRTLALREYRDVPVHQLSGGNRRRLSVAAAMIGAPRVLLLDEPTTGMDPGARRGLWLALQAARQAGHTIVLTSHAMAEADVLCTRVGILVKGKLECVGAPMDLKARVCGGYVVEARLPRDQHTAFVTGMRDTFPTASVRVAEQGPWSDIIVVTVSEEGLDVPRLFERAEELHTELHGLSYSVSQASLEHVFMHVAQLRGAHTQMEAEESDD